MKGVVKGNSSTDDSKNESTSHNKSTIEGVAETTVKNDPLDPKLPGGGLDGNQNTQDGESVKNEPIDGDCRQRKPDNSSSGHQVANTSNVLIKTIYPVRSGIYKLANSHGHVYVPLANRIKYVVPNYQNDNNNYNSTNGHGTLVHVAIGNNDNNNNNQESQVKGANVNYHVTNGPIFYVP